MISPTHFLDEAQDLLGSAETEARYRTVIGRAYYAAYHFLSMEAQKSGFTREGTGEDHARLIQFLRNHSDRKFKDSGSRLRKLRTSRTEADYKLHRWIQRPEANEALMDAEEIMEQLFSPES